MTVELTARGVRNALSELADPHRAVSSARFFKTGPGEYGEGDRFAGVTVPEQRKVARQFRGLSGEHIDDLLDGPVHEERLTALFIMRREYERAAPRDKLAWVQRYRAAVERGRVNNWDLVDSSTEFILGHWAVTQGDSSVLREYAAQQDLWRRRVGIVGTSAFLRADDASATLAVAPIVVDDRRDLIQKALGWMLREMGKRVDPMLLTSYLDGHAPELGRTALRYAIEHVTPEQRAAYRAQR